MKRSFFIFLLFLTPWGVMAEPLSNWALYNRCYGQITGKRPPRSASLSESVRIGQVEAINACFSVLNKGNLVGASISNTGDAEARAVIGHMHKVHASFFQVKDFQPTDDNRLSSHLGLKDLKDQSTPALYITRSLFSNSEYRNIARGNDILVPVRTTPEPATGPASGKSISDYMINTPFSFAAKGDLLGVRVRNPLNISYVDVGTSGNLNNAGSADLFRNLGGGLIGDLTYLELNISEATSFVADGGVSMPRKWGRAVFHDLLCRDIPVVRTLDGVPFSNAASNIPFRQAPACVSCHASIDRASSVIRGARNKIWGGYNDGNLGLQMIEVRSPVPGFAAESGWPDAADTNFWRRPTNGTLFFRSYDGALVSIDVNGPEQMGQRISEQKDFYACAAKRYYEYFTGITVDLNDINDPRFTPLSPEDAAHRDLVIQLGENLSNHQDLKQLIREIMTLDHYSLSDFGLNAAGGGE